MVVNKIRMFLTVGVIAVGAVLLWRLDTVTTERDDATRQAGQLEQSNKQLIADLDSERRQVADLSSSYQNEQARVAELIVSLERDQQRNAERQKVIYEAARQSDCGTQPLPGDLIRLRRERTPAASD